MARFTPLECVLLSPTPRKSAPCPGLAHTTLTRISSSRPVSPFPLSLTGPTFVQRYAWRQLELMEKEGLTENEARLRVDADVAAAAAALAQRAQHAAAAARGEAVPATPAGQEMSEEMLALAAAMPPTQKRAMAAVQDAEERVLHQHRQQQRRQGGGGSGPAS